MSPAAFETLQVWTDHTFLSVLLTFNYNHITLIVLDCPIGLPNIDSVCITDIMISYHPSYS